VRVLALVLVLVLVLALEHALGTAKTETHQN
jgi:hypothetical protein